MEYKVITHDDTATFEKRLNASSQEGFRLYQCIIISSPHKNYTAILQRDEPASERK